MTHTHSIERGLTQDETFIYDSQNRLSKYVITGILGNDRYTSELNYRYRSDGLISKAEVTSAISSCQTCGGNSVTEVVYDNANRPKYQVSKVFNGDAGNGGDIAPVDSSTFEYSSGNLLSKVRTFTRPSAVVATSVTTKSIVYTPDKKHILSFNGQLGTSLNGDSTLGPFYYDDGISSRSWFINSVGLRNRVQMCFDFDSRLSLYHNMAPNGPCAEVLEFRGPDYSTKLPDYLLYKNHVENKGVYSLVHNGWDEYVFFTTNPGL